MTDYSIWWWKLPTIACARPRFVADSGTRTLIFQLNVTANDVDTNSISLGCVNSLAIRDFDFATDQILDLAGNPASNAIPAMNTSRIRVDTTGPVVAGYSSFAMKGQQISVKLIFEGAVNLTGKPTVPVTVGDVDTELRYVGESGSSMLRFATTKPQSAEF